nr:SDR family oxidoreductase [Sphingomonas sp. CDS-1]
MLEGRTIIVTGAGGGIGSATAEILANAGANLILTDIGDQAEAVAASIREKGGSATFVQADVTSEEDVRRLIDSAIRTYGALHGAFNNAGIEQHSKPIYELELAEVERLLRINVTGVFLCLKYQLRAMAEGGSIVNTSSGLGQVAIAAASEYVASKHAVIGLTKGAAADAAPLGIRVNAVCPGIVATPMIRRLMDDPAQASIFDQLKQKHMLTRFATPSEIGVAVKWLLSDESSFVTGSAIPVDGGYTSL